MTAANVSSKPSGGTPAPQGGAQTSPASPAVKATPTSAAAATRSARGKSVRNQQKIGIAMIGGVAALGVIFFVSGLLNSNSSEAARSKASGLNTTTPDSQHTAQVSQNVAGEKSNLPILNTGQQQTTVVANQGLTPDEIGNTARHLNGSGSAATGSLGSVPSFGNNDEWQPMSYQPDFPVDTGSDPVLGGDKTNKDLEKSSVVFMHAATSGSGNSQIGTAAESRIGLAPGNRLRAHLESMATTAVAMPVIAIVDYNYTRGGEILVPAGAKAIGKVEQADRSGYISIRFDSLLMPDGTITPIMGLATDITLRPLKGRVEGSRAGKNIIVRSLTGIGQMGSMLIGQGNVNQPVSQADILRQQEANNIGQAADEQIAKTTVTEHIVVSIPANTAIYITLQQASNRRSLTTSQSPGATNTEELRQLLDLQRELNQNSSTSASQQR